MKKTVIITGGTSGYGLATAKAFKKAGYTTLITGRDLIRLEKAQVESGADYIFVQDVKSYDGWVELKKYADLHLGQLDVLVNNAGGGIAIRPIEEQTKETIDEILALNLNSVMYAAQIFAADMKARGAGTIINIASVCATHAWADWSVYAAAKAGVLNFTKGLQTELQPHGVRASCVIPASASTNFQSSASLGETDDSLQTEDIADTVLFVAEMPSRAIVEDVTVWGMSQAVQPL
ncbi:MAG: SDR family oxidoreductase [Clostridia bacterium]|nr:SDR family oxidoreductase [Clostridia bacterium]